MAAVCAELDGLPLAIELAAARAADALGRADRGRAVRPLPPAHRRPADRARAPPDAARARSTGATTCSRPRSRCCFAGWPCSPAGSRLRPPSGSAPATGSRPSSARPARLAGRPVAGDRRGAATPRLRYRLLETVRQYGLERLAEAGEEEALRGRHRDAFLALAEEAGPQLETGRQGEWLDVLDPEAANLAAAIDHALRSDPPSALRFCAALVPLVVRPRPLRRGRAGAFALARGLRRHPAGSERTRARESRLYRDLGGRVRRGGGARDRGAGARRRRRRPGDRGAGALRFG